jgi:ketosteroid isomerase-like protein
MTEHSRVGPSALAEGWRDALLARDADAFAALFAPDAVMVDVEHRTQDERHARPLEGRETIRAVTAAWFARTPPFTYDLIGVLADSRRAAVRWRYVVDELEVEGVSWLECEGGKIRRAFVYFDSHEFLVVR